VPAAEGGAGVDAGKAGADPGELGVGGGAGRGGGGGGDGDGGHGNAGEGEGERMMFGSGGEDGRGKMRGAEFFEDISEFEIPFVLMGYAKEGMG